MRDDVFRYSMEYYNIFSIMLKALLLESRKGERILHMSSGKALEVALANGSLVLSCVKESSYGD